MAELKAEKFKSDPRVLQARQLLLQALHDHGAALTDVQPADPERVKPYAELLNEFQNLRGASLYYPYLSSGFGRGALVELADGSVKYDFITGIGVHYLGHNAPQILEATLDAALENTLMQGNLQQNQDCADLLRLLLQAANYTGAHFEHGFITTSGAMANENALKILFQKHKPAHRILAFEHNFAGRTHLLSQVTDKPAYRIGLPENLAVDYVPFFEEANPEASKNRALQTLNEHLARHPGVHAAMIFELIQGEGGGYLGGNAEFFTVLMERLKAAQVGILIDEIQTFGRTEKPFAFQYFGLERFAEVVTVGKLTQVCATLVTAAYKPGPALVSQTFTASTVAIKAAQTILKALLNGDYLGPQGRIQRLSNRFRSHIQSLAKQYPKAISGPYGMGAMVAFTPYEGDADRAASLLKDLFQAGVIGFIAGSKPARIRFLLPVGSIQNEDIDQAARILGEVLARQSF